MIFGIGIDTVFTLDDGKSQSAAQARRPAACSREPTTEVASPSPRHQKTGLESDSSPSPESRVLELWMSNILMDGTRLFRDRIPLTQAHALGGYGSDATRFTRMQQSLTFIRYSRSVNKNRAFL